MAWFDPKKLLAAHTEEHLSKGMIQIDNDTFTLTQECNTCGKFRLGPVPVAHMASIGKQLMNWGVQLGLPVGETSVTQHLAGDDISVLTDGAKVFEEMDINDADNFTSAWGGKRRS